MAWLVDAVGILSMLLCRGDVVNLKIRSSSDALQVRRNRRNRHHKFHIELFVIRNTFSHHMEFNFGFMVLSPYLFKTLSAAYMSNSTENSSIEAARKKRGLNIV